MSAGIAVLAFGPPLCSRITNLNCHCILQTFIVPRGWNQLILSLPLNWTFNCHRRFTFLVRGEMLLQLICSIAKWSWMVLLSWITQIGKCTLLLIYLFGSLVKCGNHCNMFSFVSLVHCAGQTHQHKVEVESLLCKHRHHKLSAAYPSCIRRQVLLLSIEYLSSHPVQLVLHSCHSGCRLALQLDF